MSLVTLELQYQRYRILNIGFQKDSSLLDIMVAEVAISIVRRKESPAILRTRKGT